MANEVKVTVVDTAPPPPPKKVILEMTQYQAEIVLLNMLDCTPAAAHHSYAADNPVYAAYNNAVLPVAVALERVLGGGWGVENRLGVQVRDGRIYAVKQ